jgi:hypothetical protein
MILIPVAVRLGGAALIYYFFAAFSTAEPTFCTSLPKPCMVLQALSTHTAIVNANSFPISHL